LLGCSGGGTGETDLDLDPFDPNVASSPPVHSCPFPFITLPFLAREIAPSSSSCNTGEGALGCTADADAGAGARAAGAEAGAEAEAGVHWMICDGADTDMGTDVVAPSTIPVLDPAWIFFAATEDEGG
jgi:hypothetical protein